MKRLQQLRESKSLSQRQLGCLSHVDNSDISRAENRGLHLYYPQAKRIADVLGWEGSPEELFEEVK